LGIIRSLNLKDLAQSLIKIISMEVSIKVNEGVQSKIGAR
jgi:hypothetical protein